MSSDPGQSGKGPKRPAAAERRSGERHHFSASAEAMEATSGARLAARVADLSASGCYLDTINPFAVGTRVRLRIRRDAAELTCEGEVKTSQIGMGMGVAFIGLDSARKALIAGWLGDVVSPPNQDFDSAVTWETAKPAVAASPQVRDDLTIRLIEILHSRGVLSDSDATDLLKGVSKPRI